MYLITEEQLKTVQNFVGGANCICDEINGMTRKCFTCRVTDILDNLPEDEQEKTIRKAKQLIAVLRTSLIAMCEIYDTDGDHSVSDGENARNMAAVALAQDKLLKK